MDYNGEIKIKSVVVGDGYVGKTCMVMRYDSFPSYYLLAIVRIHSHWITFRQCLITTQPLSKSTRSLSNWLFGTYSHSIHSLLRDTAGQDDYERLRTLSYTLTDAFLVCFSLVDQESFKNALYKVRQQSLITLFHLQWIPELFQNAPNAPIILVGTKLDLKQEYEKDPEKRKKVVSSADVKDPQQRLTILLIGD